MPQQHEDFVTKWKRNFNITYNLCLIHQRGIVVLMRDQWGKRALGTSCALALVLMFLWATFTQDPFMYGWMVLWFICYLKRRFEAGRLAKKGMHTEYDGRSKDGQRFGFSERFAKRWVEPMLTGILGGMVYWFYERQGWQPTGLPYFLLSGLFTLPFVQTVHQSIWDRRVEAMNEARITQQAAMKDFQDRYGNY
jgi:hypothetical protein